MTDLDHTRALIDEIGNPHRAATEFNRRLEAAGICYRMCPTSMSRIYKGEVRPALAGFIRYVLTQAADRHSIGYRMSSSSHTVY